MLSSASLKLETSSTPLRAIYTSPLSSSLTLMNSTKCVWLSHVSLVLSSCEPRKPFMLFIFMKLDECLLAQPSSSSLHSLNLKRKKRESLAFIFKRNCSSKSKQCSLWNKPLTFSIPNLLFDLVFSNQPSFLYSRAGRRQSTFSELILTKLQGVHWKVKNVHSSPPFQSHSTDF